MPHTKSAFKRLRQSKKAAAYNATIKTKIHKLRKRLLAAIQSGNIQKSKQILALYYSAVDKAVKKGVIHKNTAARKKARVTEKFNRLLQAESASAPVQTVGGE